MSEMIKQSEPINNGPRPNALFRFVYLYRDGVLSAFIIVLLAFIIAGGFYLYKNDIKSSNDALYSLESTLAQEKVKLADLKAVKVDLSQMEDSIKRLYAALPYEADLPGLYLQTVALMKNNGLTLGSFNAATPETEDASAVKIVELGVNVSGGDYFSLKKFLADVASSLRLTDVRALTYSPISKSYTAVLNAYYLIED
jgi:Tfp pilus assembly protein PilO